MRGPSLGTSIAAVGAVLLIVSLFLDWFEPGFSAWTAFEVWDLVLAVLGLAVLAAAAAEAGLWKGPARPAPLLGLAVAVLVIVVAALINHPPAAIGRDLAEGAWLALAAGVLLVLGALLADTRLKVSFQVDRNAPDPGPEPTGPTRAQP